MSDSVLLMRVAAAWPLPGLGLLALPAGPTPHLAAYALHTAVAVEVAPPGGPRRAAIATVEEVSRPDAPVVVERGLLLDFGAPEEVPAGSEIWLAASQQQFSVE